MSVKCGKCCADLDSADNTVKCVECSSVFHLACTRLGPSKNITKTKLKNFKCDNCHGDTASVKSTEDQPLSDTQPILEALAAMKNEIIANTDSKVAEVNGSIKLLSDKFDHLELKIKKIEDGQGELCRRCDTLEFDRDSLQEQVQDLTQRLHDTEQHSRSANLEIVGLPVSHKEDIFDVLSKLSSVVNVPIKKDDISMAHRLRAYSKRHTYPPIIVQFTSRTTREAWLSAARRKRGVKSTDIAAGLPPSTIYINEQLTRHNKELLGRARRLMREKKIHFAGFFNGKVLVKPTADPNAQSVRVVDLKDLDKYDK